MGADSCRQLLYWGWPCLIRFDDILSPKKKRKHDETRTFRSWRSENLGTNLMLEMVFPILRRGRCLDDSFSLPGCSDFPLKKSPWRWSDNPVRSVDSLLLWDDCYIIIPETNISSISGFVGFSAFLNLSSLQVSTCVVQNLSLNWRRACIDIVHKQTTLTLYNTEPEFSISYYVPQLRSRCH